MKKISVAIPEKNKMYPIFIGQGLLGAVNTLIDLKAYSRIMVLSDSTIEKTFILDTLAKSLPTHEQCILPPGEKEKTIENVQTIWKNLIAKRFDRKSLIINVGGGVICDMGSFAASTYLRGIDFLQIPTTLLAQVDASIGGKTGIDFLDMKNIIGTFNQPIGIVNDVAIVKTLPKRLLLEGFGEIVKHGLIADKAYFHFVTSKKPDEFTEQEMITIIEHSCQLKVHIIEQDETENNSRKILNFGHTIGHAIESASLETDHPLLHGEAVAIGIMAEAIISEKIALLSAEETQEIKIQLAQTGLPIKVKNISFDTVLKNILYDKKNERGQIQWTLLDAIGHAVINKQVQEEVILSALQEIIA